MVFKCWKCTFADGPVTQNKYQELYDRSESKATWPATKTRTTIARVFSFRFFVGRRWFWSERDQKTTTRINKRVHQIKTDRLAAHMQPSPFLSERHTVIENGHI